MANEANIEALYSMFSKLLDRKIQDIQQMTQRMPCVVSNSNDYPLVLSPENSVNLAANTVNEAAAKLALIAASDTDIQDDYYQKMINTSHQTSKINFTNERHGPFNGVNLACFLLTV